MLQASVIICSHNPRPRYLRRVLEALRNQSFPKDQWELLLVDNKSDEPLTAKNADLAWHPHSRHVREDELGLMPARLRGMREAAADMLVFVDDDNVLGSSYLSEAVRVKRDWPILGSWGSGRTVPEFEVSPPEHLKEFMEMLALRDVSRPQWSNIIPCVGARPWGAGQCVRAEVAHAYRHHIENSKLTLVGRRGHALSSSEDVEIGFVSCTMGLGVGVFPELELTHLIPKERIEEDYLVRLAEGIGASGAILQYKWEDICPISPFSGPLELLRTAKNVISRKGVHRRMYLAGIRARCRARKAILESKFERHRDKFAQTRLASK